MKIWNFGIIGAGNISDFHAKAVKSLRHAKLVGICGTNQEKVKALALKYSCRAFNDTTELLESPDIDIILIATPSGSHMGPAIEAARYGKHVLCEKGMVYGSTASYPGQPRRLEIAGTKGTVIMEDSNFKILQFDKQLEEDFEIKRKYSTIERGGGASDPLFHPVRTACSKYSCIYQFS